MTRFRTAVRPLSRRPNRRRTATWTFLLVTGLLAGACQSGSGTPAAAVRAAAAEKPDGRTGSLEAAEPDRGMAWQWDAPAPATVGMPAVDFSGIAVAYGHLKLVVLDRRGRVRWESERPGLRDVAPLLTSGAVLAATDDGVVAFHRDTGRVLWDSPFGQRANTPVATGALVVASTWDASVVALDLHTGRVAWRTPLPGAALGPSASGGGSLVVTSWEAERAGEDGTRRAGLTALDARSGEVRWQAPLRGGGVSAPAVGGDRVVLVDATLAAHGFDLATGSHRWSTTLDGAGAPEVPPVVIDAGRVLVAHRQGGMVELDPSSGRLRWKTDPIGAIAVRGGPTGPTSGGRFVLPLDDGTLLFTGGDSDDFLLDPPGRVTGVALYDGILLVATREAGSNSLFAVDGW